MLRGWIAARYDDKEFLESLGIKLGEYDYAETEFTDCEVSEEAMKKLDRYWGEFTWYLK